MKTFDRIIGYIFLIVGGIWSFFPEISHANMNNLMCLTAIGFGIIIVNLTNK